MENVLIISECILVDFFLNEILQNISKSDDFLKTLIFFCWKWLTPQREFILFTSMQAIPTRHGIKLHVSSYTMILS